MFLRNFDNATLLQLGFGLRDSTFYIGGSYSILGTSYNDGSIAVKQTNGSTSMYKVGGSPSSSYLNSLLSLRVADICLGDGTTSVTYDDYKLSGNVVKNALVKVSNEIIYESSTKEYISTLVATYTNSTDNPITISEWGLFASHAMSSGTKGTYSNDGAYILLTREVLDEPVVIEAGTTATLTFTLRVGLMHQV